MRRRHLRNARIKRKLSVQTLESRRLLAADSIGVTPQDTGEFLLGTVAVTPVFFESDGTLDPSTEDWDADEISGILDKIHESVDWWSDTLDALDTVHTLDFVVDDLYAQDPVETPYEPINRSSSQFNRYVGDFLTSLGYGDASSIEDGVRQFNHAQRLKHQTDWAFTIFVLDSSNDPDGVFPRGSEFTGAFAYPGGLFYITPSTRPTSTYAHEMGHLFWARDEYSGGSSWDSNRGYYDTQNTNSVQNNPDPFFTPEPSIMQGGASLQQAFEQHISPASTLAMIGWQDSDGDGVFDVADVPLSLDAVGYFDSVESVYRFSGTASAEPLINRNSSGTQSDITLNRISQLQYRLDDGPWVVAAEPNQPKVDFDLTLEISASDFSTIQWRAIDQTIGVVSPTLTGTTTTPATTSSSLSGVAFLDENSNGLRDLGETGLGQTTVTVRNSDGSPLFAGSVLAVELPEGDLPNGDLAEELDGISLATIGTVFDTKVASLDSVEAGNVKVFQAFNQQQQQYTHRWTGAGASEVNFTATLDQTVGQVSIDAIGLDEISYARVEAYDSSGDLIARTTSEALAAEESLTVTLTDPLGRISYVIVTGHAGTAIAISGLRFGQSGAVTTDTTGIWQVADLPQGSYQVGISTEFVIHHVADSSMTVDVQTGTSEQIVSAAVSVDSPRHNVVLPADTNRDGAVDALDALLVINDISRNDSRILTAAEGSGDEIDVSNDGVISALDALLVINQIAISQISGQTTEPEALGAGIAATQVISATRIIAATRGLTASGSHETTPPPANPAGNLDSADKWDSAGDQAYAESIDALQADDRNDEIKTDAVFPEITTSPATVFPVKSGKEAGFPSAADKSSRQIDHMSSPVSRRIEEPFDDWGIQSFSAETE